MLLPISHLPWSDPDDHNLAGTAARAKRAVIFVFPEVFFSLKLVVTLIAFPCLGQISAIRFPASISSDLFLNEFFKFFIHFFSPLDPVYLVDPVKKFPLSPLIRAHPHYYPPISCFFTKISYTRSAQDRKDS